MSTLKELTKEKHTEAESQPFIQALFKKAVDKYDYADYLFQLHMIYYTLESLGDHLEVFKGIEEIKRAPLVRKDFAELVSSSTKQIGTVRSSTSKYINYLNTLAYKDDNKKLWSHIYVRHMGDLFGGQALKKLVPGSGKMFEFDNLIFLITEMRNRLSVDMADEANLAFQFNIDIIKEFNGKYLDYSN